MKVQRNKTKAMSQNNWFDLECETEKENLKSLGEQISQEPNNSQLRHFLKTKRNLNGHADRKNESLSVRV